MRKLITTAIATTIAIGLINMKATGNELPLKVGDVAPEFEAKDQNGNVWKLSDYIGKKNVLIYFYPKDNTPGCTKEACAFRDNIGNFKSAEVEVVGVSMDTIESHKRFISQHNLNFTLLSDVEGKVVEKYGTRMPGKNMARRVSFLINKEGKIVHITDNPDAQVHIDEIKKAINNLKAK
ncbi:MAG: peroxiredoxin [Verrucomicrobiia bacterium]|jgi:peroxiredoxin Q/BCP